jgi:hypothetical protein
MRGQPSPLAVLDETHTDHYEAEATASERNLLVLCEVRRGSSRYSGVLSGVSLWASGT